MYYKLGKESNKVNLCWVFSDGRRGHEIQSTTLAQSISKQSILHQFNLRQPWLSFTPRLLPKFDLAINWVTTKPDTTKLPELIISTGRKAAAVGKFYRQMLHSLNHPCKHIQILNPKDNLNNYDVVLIPEHDRVQGVNVINYRGSIHPYGEEWFAQYKDDSFSQYLAIFLGNPNKNYFKAKFAEEITIINRHFKDSPLFFCGSPRLNPKIQNLIAEIAKPTDKIWLCEKDGANPYQPLLKNAKKIFITSDSINMINEACQSPLPVSILAINYIPTPKHQRFINSTNHRICSLESLNVGKSFENPMYQIANECLLQLKQKSL